jgi:hypothetical protein
MKPNFTALWEELWIGWARWPAGKRLARPWTFSCQTAIRNRLVQLRGCPEIGYSGGGPDRCQTLPIYQSARVMGVLAVWGPPVGTTSG